MSRLRIKAFARSNRAIRRAGEKLAMKLWRKHAKRARADEQGLARVADLSNGVILYRGPSEIDGRPIVVVATGIAKGTSNTKTSDMVQTWILIDDGTPPQDHVRNGTDGTVCGDCVYAHGNGCYVLVHQAPRAVWDGVQRDIYPTVTPVEAAELFRGASVRFGSYGDPCAVPLTVWYRTVASAGQRTGYTHQWRKREHRQWGWLMASADTSEDRAHAHAQGWRWFSVSDQVEDDSLHCPADKTDGRVGCGDCGLCDGMSHDITIPSHGWKARAAKEAVASKAAA